MNVMEAARRANTMPASAIREIMALASGFPNLIHLEIGDPDLATPSHIIEAAFQAAKEGWTKYTANAGLPSLRSLIAERVKRKVGGMVSSEQIIVTVGAVEALFTAVMAVVEFDTGVYLILSQFDNRLIRELKTQTVKAAAGGADMIVITILG